MHSFAYLFPLLMAWPAAPETVAHEVALGFNEHINYTTKMIPRVYSYLDMISQSLFVDKSLLIEDILGKPDWHYIITCPSKWGKTMNIDMLKTFVQMQVHQNGTRILPICETPVYDLFTKGECRYKGVDIKLRKPLLISAPQYRHVIDKYLGQHPVISMSFAGMPWVGQKRHAMLKGIIAKAFEEHRYMLGVYDDIINDQAYYSYEREEVADCRNKFVQYLTGDLKTADDLLKAIEFLRNQLYDHFKAKVFIMIDEYDRMFDLNSNFSAYDYFFSNTLRYHESLEKAILTGTTRISFDLHDVCINRFLESPYYPYYGFTQREMNLLYDLFEVSPENQKILQYWYGGYEVTNTTGTEAVFNPWSVCKYMNNLHLRTYWIEINSRDINLLKIVGSPDFQNVFNRLINGKGYTVDYSAYSKCSRTWNTFDVISDINQALHYLKGTGYLTVKIADPNRPSVYTYKIPNYEIASYLPTIFAAKMNKLLKNRYYSQLTHTSYIWQQCLLGNESSPHLIVNHTRKYFEYLTTYFAQEYRLNTVDSWVLTLVMATYTCDDFRFISWQFVRRPKAIPGRVVPRRPDIVFSSKDRGFVIFVNFLKGTESAPSVANHVDWYLKMFQEYPTLHDWKYVQFVSFNLLSNSSLCICSILHPLCPSARAALNGVAEHCVVSR